MAKQLDKIYNPRDVEARLYKEWEEKGYFHAEVDEKKKAFSIVMPPPNVTGQLHLGHALDCTLQDVLTRTKRMQGYSALWLPGTDHAGIATQIKVEAALREEEGLTRHDLGRDKFLERVWDWKNKFGNRIVEQQKKMGASCDWERSRFTMDDICAKAVREVFVRLYEKGLIYQGNRIINWCPNCTTALSDAEVEYSEMDGKFWHIKYPVKDSDEYVVIATTRPETMMGDTAVAVHPEDERYTHLVGKTLILPIMNREIPVIADEYVEREFGTGCVKITPCHDPNDFEVGKRHNLEEILVIDEHGCINENGGKYNGLDRYEARKQLVADLEKEGYLLEIRDHKHNVGQCYRCNTVVEPLTSKQWFVKMGPLAEEALRVVNDGTVKFVPDRFSKIYTNWMENVHDWCISRQLWWGHRIPAFYCEECGHVNVSREDPTECAKCGSKKLRQEEDVLDTWFSSALWPFSTLGWPEKTPELDYFYPTSVMVTGYDIIFFWVARMIFSGMEHLKLEPFKTVFIHGIVRDALGRKMSKSLNNGVDPLEVIEEYGADALRFTLITGNSPGNDTRFIPERVEANRNFANKIWNASRFVMMNLSIDECVLPEEKELALEDKWILSKYNTLVSEITDNIDKYELGIAAQKLQEFIRDNYCDWYIELVKPRLSDDADEKSKKSAQQVLCYVLSNTLKLLHPFMPFITEEIWQTLPHEGESIMISKWPEYSDALNFKTEEENIETLMQAIRGIRNRRAEMNVPPSRKAQLIVVPDNDKAKAVFELGRAFFIKLASASEVIMADGVEDTSKMVSVVSESAKLFVPMNELIDTEAEIARLKKEREKCEKDFNMINGKLSNAGFVAKAPANVVVAEREKLEKVKALLANIDESIAKLKA
ncbi:MAG: valine--tRNA ligase [Oscillospiraceae bacterium]|nr:valine--tRNA ligase [Oscillospiraceae bacterium]